jgi:2-aminobenzoate-CoA ligase
MKAPDALLPSAHVDDFARRGLPPLEDWPLLNLEGAFAYPDRLNAAVTLLDDAVRDGHGDRVALNARDGKGDWHTLTYRELQVRVDGVAHMLVRDLGIVAGNRVLLRGYNGPTLMAAWLAVLKAGGVAVTTMPMLRARELQTVLQKSECRFALCDSRLEHELAAAAAAVALGDEAGDEPVNGAGKKEGHGIAERTGHYAGLERTVCWGLPPDDEESLDALSRTHMDPFPAVDTSSDDVCLIAFTSGTTGVPKGCVHFHRDVLAMCDAFSAQTLRPGQDDRFIGTPPLAFTFGLGGLLAFPLHARATAVLLESATPETLLDAIAQSGATITFTAPTFYRLMALAMSREPGRYDTSSLRQSVSAGEALPDSTRTLWRDATGVNMLDGIGATEMIHIFIAASGADVRTGAIGKAVPGYEVAVLGDDLEPAATGEIGRLAVRGPTGCRYLNDERQKSYVQRGWNLTGDACTMDDDGYVYFKARTDDLIISSGYNIGAPEVEAAVLEHPVVAECAVVGVPDADRGQCVKAFIVLKPDVTASDELAHDIQEHVKRTIAPYKYPRRVEFVASLPRTETGKLQRFRLKAPA